MKVKGICSNFSDWTTISFLIVCPICTNSCKGCQNANLRKLPTFEIKNSVIIENYLQNKTAKTAEAIIFGGLDAWDSLDEIIEFLKEFRSVCNDDVILYTGRELKDIEKDFKRLSMFDNVYVKYGAYIEGRNKKYSAIGNVLLSSDNQDVIKLTINGESKLKRDLLKDKNIACPECNKSLLQCKSCMKYKRAKQ